PVDAVPVAKKPAPAPSRLVVANAGAEGVRLRAAPGSGEALKVLQDGTGLVALGDERQEGGRTWRKVRDDAGTEGWVAADFLSSASEIAPSTALPAATPTRSSATSVGPSGTPTGSAAGPAPSAQTPQRAGGGGQAQPRSGACPPSHPIKGNIAASGERIYHLPSGAFYSRTFPEANSAPPAHAPAAGARASQR